MCFKNLFFLFFFVFLFSESKTKNIKIDTTINVNQKIYKWIITNPNNFTKKINIPLIKNDIDSILYIIIEHLENQGYPFASAEFIHDSIIDYNIYGKVLEKKGSLTKIDSISIKGYNKFPSYLINRFIDLKPTSIYQESKIKNLSNKLKSNAFIEEYQNNTILFNEQKTILFLYLQKKTNNSIDGFLGLNNNQEKLSVFGKINLTLLNALNIWEEIQMNWNKITEFSQELSIKIKIPFVLNSIFTTMTEFNILQYENMYINREFQTSIEFKAINQFFNLGYMYKNSNDINESTHDFIQDFTTNLFLLNWRHQTKELLKNKLNYNILIENKFGIQNNGEKIEKRGHLTLEIKLTGVLFKNNNFYLTSKNEFLTGNNILENEKIGLGGIKNIRGFLENSFFSQSVSIINLENKYFFNGNSYLSLFSDFARLYDSENTISSFGLGLGLEMEKDIFSINYAIPKYNQVIEYNNAKIHFNYLLKF